MNSCFLKIKNEFLTILFLFFTHYLILLKVDYMLSKCIELLYSKYKKIIPYYPFYFIFFIEFNLLLYLIFYFIQRILCLQSTMDSYITPFIYYSLFYYLIFYSISHTIKALFNKTNTSEHERQKLTSLSNVKNSYYSKSNTDLHFQYCWFGPEFKGTSPTTQNTKIK